MVQLGLIEDRVNISTALSLPAEIEHPQLEIDRKSRILCERLQTGDNMFAMELSENQDRAFESW
jgi:hypothetical protein